MLNFRGSGRAERRAPPPRVTGTPARLGAWYTVLWCVMSCRGGFPAPLSSLQVPRLLPARHLSASGRFHYSGLEKQSDKIQKMTNQLRHVKKMPIWNLMFHHCLMCNQIGHYSLSELQVRKPGGSNQLRGVPRGGETSREGHF